MKVTDENETKVKEFLIALFKHTYNGYKKFEFTTIAREYGITNPSPVRKYLINNDIIKFISGKYYWWSDRAPNSDMVHNLLIDLNKPKIGQTKLVEPVKNQLQDSKNFNYDLDYYNSIINHKYYNDLCNMINTIDFTKPITNLSKILSNYVNKNSAANIATAMFKANLTTKKTDNKFFIRYNVLPEYIIMAIKDLWKDKNSVKTHKEYCLILNKLKEQVMINKLTQESEELYKNKVESKEINNNLLSDDYLKENYSTILKSIREHKYYDGLLEFIKNTRPSTNYNKSEMKSRISQYLNKPSDSVFNAMKISRMFIGNSKNRYVIEPRLRPEHIILAVRDLWKTDKPVLSYEQYDKIINTLISIDNNYNTSIILNDNNIIASTNHVDINNRLTDLNEATKCPITDFLSLVECKRNDLFEELKNIKKTKEELNNKENTVSKALSHLDTALSNIKIVDKTLNNI